MQRIIALGLAAATCSGCGGEPAPSVSEQESVAAFAVTYDGPDQQFHASFSPSNALYGGFGGGNCTATRTPVVFVPGNGDDAKNWDFPPSTGGLSVYETFRTAGYSDCELFGINYLSVQERAEGVGAYHTPARAALIADFIDDVKAYTGSTQVDVISHSLGVTMGLEALRQNGLYASTRRFIGIGAGMRGLASCYSAGYANPALPVCGSANWFNSSVFGFYPGSWWAPNPRMSSGGFRDDPRNASNTRFYTIRAGYNDQVACTTSAYYSDCYKTAMFDGRSNVYAQLDVGDGSTAAQLDFDFADWSPYALGAGDSDGVGHFRSKNNTGAIQVQMLTTQCQGTTCCTGYTGVCGN